MIDEHLMRIALKEAATALDDWTATYAPEFCNRERVGEAFTRIHENGGTLAYIAKVRQQLRDALADES